MRRGESSGEIVHKIPESAQLTENMIYCKFSCVLSANAAVVEEVADYAVVSLTKTLTHCNFTAVAYHFGVGSGSFKT